MANDFLRDAPPELIDALLGANSGDYQNALLKMMYEEAQQKEQTQQPGLIRGERNMMYAASPLANIAATLRQIQGSQGSNAALQQMMANYLRKGDALKMQLAHEKAMEAAQNAPGPEGIMAPKMMEDRIPGLGQEGPDITEGRVPRGEPGQSGPKHDFGPYMNPDLEQALQQAAGKVFQPSLGGPRGYKPMPWNSPGPATGLPWER